MKNPNEKLRVERVESQIPRARREKLLIRRLSIDKSVLGLRWRRRENWVCRKMKGVANSNTLIITQNRDMDLNRQIKSKKGWFTGNRGELVL
jgi:hypothetical protein